MVYTCANIFHGPECCKSCTFMSVPLKPPYANECKRNRCINATPFIGRENAGEVDATKVDQEIYAHFKVGVLSSESFLFQIICHCFSNDHDFTLISQTEYTLFRKYGIADSGNG